MHLFATFTNPILSGTGSLHARQAAQPFLDTPSLVNPYTTLRIQARLALYPKIPRSTCNQLFVLSAIYALIAFVALASLVVAAKRRNLGFIDKYASARSDRRFCVPRWTTLFPAAITLFAGLAQGYLWSVIAVDRGTKDQSGFVLWQTIIWLPLWFAGYALIWHFLFNADVSKLAASHFPDESTPPSLRYVRIAGIARWLPSPPVTNTLFWLLPILVTVFTMTPFGFANRAYNHVFHAWQDLDRVLAQADSSFDGTIYTSVSTQIQQLRTVMVEEKDETIRFVRVGYVVYTIVGWVLCVASFVLLGVMLRIFKRQTAGLLAASKREQAGEIPPVKPTYEARHAAMVAYTRTFVSVVSSVFLVTGIYTVISLSIAIQPTTSGRDVSKYATSSRMLAGLWTFAVVGSLATAAVLYHALYSPAGQVSAGAYACTPKECLKPLTLTTDSAGQVTKNGIQGPKITPMMIGKPLLMSRSDSVKSDISSVGGRSLTKDFQYEEKKTAGTEKIAFNV